MTQLASTAEAPARVQGWASVTSLVREQPWLLVITTTMIGWSAVLVFTVRSHFAEFRLQRYDLGNMVQAVWSTAHGRPLEITLGTGEQAERLAAHVDPILVLLAPFWLIAPSPLTLATVQIAACAFGALPVYWLGRRHLASQSAAGLLALTYLAYPWLAWTALDAIHPVALAIPLFLFCIWFLDSERLVPFAVCAVLAASTGELMALPIAMLGLWYFSRGNRLAGTAIATAGLAWTITCIKLIVPAFSGGESPFYGYYSSVGGSPEGVIRTAVTNPGAIVDAVMTIEDLGYLVALSVPVSGAFLLVPGLAVAALPPFAANSLSSIEAALDPRGHHTAAIIAFVVAASVLGVARLPKSRHLPAAAAVFVLSAVGSLLTGPWPGVPGQRLPWLQGSPEPEHVAALRAAVAMVPDDVAVAATNKAGSHLSARRYFYSVPRIQKADWIVLDMNDAWVPLPPRSRERVTWGRRDAKVLRALRNRLAASHRWEKIYQRNGVFVFRRSRT